MFLMNTVVGIIAPVLIPEGDILMFSIEAGLNFGAGLLIMLYGVRLLINQNHSKHFKGLQKSLYRERNQHLMCLFYSIIDQMQ